MSSSATPPQRLMLARQLIREKGLSKTDLALLEDILREGAGVLTPLVEAAPVRPGVPVESPAQADLRRNLGLFLAFLHQFSPRRLGEARAAMGLVLLHSLGRLRAQAEAAHREVLAEHRQPDWVIQLLDLLASIQAMGPDAQVQGQDLGALWAAFIADRKEAFRQVLSELQTQEAGAETVARLNAQMKAVNRAVRGQGRLGEALTRLAEQLEACIPEAIHARLTPLILLERVLSNLRLSLLRPLDQGIHWPAVEQVRGSLRWLWDHLGWTLPRMDADLLRASMSPELRRLLQQIRQEDRPTFAVVARALASHISLLSLLEAMAAAPGASPEERYASVPTFLVLESELGRMAEQGYSRDQVGQLDLQRPETSRLRALLRQAVLTLRQDQTTVRSLVHQALASQDADHLGQTLENLRSLLVNHQKQLMGEMVGIFSPEAQHRLFPDSPSMMEEGDRLRAKVHRLWEQVPPIYGQLQVDLELQDWPRLALGLSTAYRHLLGFRRSVEFPLMRRPDREEAERLIQDLGRLLESREDVTCTLRDGMELLGELIRFLELFLLRINARVPLIRQDLEVAQEALACIGELQEGPTGTDRTRQSHRLIQTAKRLGVRDPQAVAVLKRWVRAERSHREDTQPALDQLAAHLHHLVLRLEAALG